MFEQVLESLRKATEANLQVQQEMFKKWVGLWPEMSPAPAWGGQAQQLQKKWSEMVGELLRRQRETVEAQFKLGVENIEAAFRLGEAKTVEELRAKTLELWQKCFESLRKVSEAQVRDTQAALEKWAEFMTKPAV